MAVDPGKTRLQAALEELDAIQDQQLTGYDLIIRNNQGKVAHTAELIYRAFCTLL